MRATESARSKIARNFYRLFNESGYTIITQDRQSSRMSVSGLAIFSARDLEARHGDRFHNSQCVGARRGRDPRRGAFDRRQLRISADRRAHGIQPQSGRAGNDLVGEGALPVHRSDLARDPQESVSYTHLTLPTILRV